MSPISIVFAIIWVVVFWWLVRNDTPGYSRNKLLLALWAPTLPFVIWLFL
jgi:hypothetical protein